MRKFSNRIRAYGMRRVASALLALVLLLGMMPAGLPQVQAAWVDEYIDKVVEWGVMRGDVDGNMNGDAPITRAEFVTMVNRAFGYTASTFHPFEDVVIGDWYNDDIGIAYNMGYFKGVGDNLAEPKAYLTREQAVVLIGRNLLLEEKKGETLGFSDSRTFNDWSRGMVESAVDAGYVSGYVDGSFKPQNYITRGEVAVMLVKAIGSMVHTPGTHSMGGVYGNVMISTSGVTLKDTTIAGNLYITGGLELGDILLDNVVVLGKIIVSGAGASHKGDSSVILRNVESGELVIDSIADQFVTLRAEGDTQIDFTNVKTGAFLDDQTAVGDGLLYVEINGENGIEVTMAGNVEEVLNRTPESVLTIAEGNAQFVTIDENAVGSLLEIRNIAEIEELNLDIGVPVTGEGDISEININAPGAVVDVLPDDINIRPGLEAEIVGEEMDTKDGEESSIDPRLLAGYPKVKNIAPTSADIVFRTNKKGTIYWALTNLIDGPVGAEDLIEEKDYKTTILQQGQLNVTAAETDLRTKISKLVEDGSYYVSVVFVDSRGQQSAVKHIRFSTPDGTPPKFASGYPELTLIKMDYAQVSVMSTKSSQLFYAVLPKGAGAPTIDEFKAGAVSGDLGNCPVDGIPVTKNVVRILNVCEEGKLEEKKSYELYLCLIDPDNGKDSGVRRISFTTVDGTPPYLEDAVVTGIQKNNVNLSTYLDEAGTIYWVAVKAGLDYLGDAEMDSRKAILQVANGMGNIVKAGKASASANKEVTVKVGGLQPETSYDVYYVAEDKAGNFSGVKMINVNTLDTVAPTVRQEFTKTADAAGKDPLAETDVRLIFSEGVRNLDSESNFFDLYRIINSATSAPQDVAEAKRTLLQELERSIQLWDVTNVSAAYQVRHDGNATEKDLGNWINYNKVKMEMTEDGDLIMTFRHGEAISLSSGSTYQFVIENVTDVSNTKNPIKPNPYKMEKFTTVFAQVNLTGRAGSASVAGAPLDRLTGQDIEADMRFWMDPQSTDSVNSNVYYDIWFETENVIVHFDLYCRVVDPAASKEEQIITDPSELSMFAQAGDPDANGWTYLGNMEISASGGMARGSVNGLINGTNTTRIAALNTLRDQYVYEFVIDVTAVDEKVDQDSWSADIKLTVRVPAGQDLSATDYAKTDPWTNDVTNIGNPQDFSVSRKFIDTKTPRFRDGYPTFTPGDSAVRMNIMLDRAGMIYYVVAPLVSNGAGGLTTSIPTVINDAKGNEIDFEKWFKLNEFPAKNGKNLDPENPLGKYTLATPTPDGVALMVDKGVSNTEVKTGKMNIGNTIQSIMVEGLTPETTYIVYALLKGESQSLSKVCMFQFTTNKVSTPTIELNLLPGGSGVTATTSTDSELSWVLYTNTIAEALFGGSSMLFKSYLADGVLESDYEAACRRITNSDPDTITVLEALTLSMSDKRSIFDAFGNDYIKDYVLQRVQMEASSYQQPTDMGDKSFTGGKSEEIEPGNMSEEVVYYIIAAARNSMGQTYGYKAQGGLHLSDIVPPELRDPYTSVDGFVSELSVMPLYIIKLSEARKGDPYDYMYQGSVEVSFSERIYQLLATGDSLETERIAITEKNFESKINMDKIRINRDNGKKGVKISGGTIKIDFIDAQIGSYITIFDEGSICDASGNVLNQGARLRLTMIAELTPEDENYQFAIPTFLVSWVE